MKGFNLSLVLLISFTLHARAQNNSIDGLNPADTPLKISDNYAVYMTLGDSIEEGLRKNYSEKIRKYEFEINELSYLDSKQDFYLPKLSLIMGLNQDHFTENIYRDQINNSSSPKTPDGYFGVQFDDYTIFNWGKDYLDFLNAKASYKRQKESVKEQRRALRFQIILAYADMAKNRKITKYAKQKLRHASFIYRLAKEQLYLRKIKGQEYLQSKTEFLLSHQNYHNSLADYSDSQKVFANYLGAKLEAPYTPREEIKFSQLTINKTDATKLVIERNPTLKDARLALNNANRSYKKAIKENLPLPKFSLKLGAYQRSFSSSGVQDEYRTFGDSNNAEIAASLNMKWTLYGSGGLLNSRVTKKSFYQKKIAELKLKDSQRQTEVETINLFNKIKHLEKEFKATTALKKNVQKVFDKTLDNYISRKTSFLNMKETLEQLHDSSVLEETVKFNHLTEKITLAVLMGVDDFPGEQFENMVLR